jgi:hypothetical protein
VIIAVHLQKDVVNADGAFGGFFAAQAVERDVVGVNLMLLDAARRAGSSSAGDVVTKVFSR